MTTREQLAILALLIVLLALAILFPRPAASDAPAAASRIPASEFGAIRSADPLASGQASISADPSLRTLDGNSASDVVLAPANEARIPSPSASLRVPTATPVRIPAQTERAASVTGISSWYCGHGSACTRGYPAAGMYAAAGPALRVGDWRGRVVTVTAGGRQVAVKLIDVCACTGGRVLDLYSSAFSRLAPLSRGIVEVSVRW